MSKLLEVEIENKSYILLLDLEQQQTNTLKLTTLKDNQSAVIIKIYLNKLDERILIKEFNVRNLKPKVSGLPRFELSSSYNNQILNLGLKVDGRKVENTEIKLGSYFRNKFLPLFIILGLLAIFLLFAGGKWLFSSLIFIDTPTKQYRPEVTSVENTNIEMEKVTEEPAPVIEKNIEGISEAQNSSKDMVIKEETTLNTAYFTPNNTEIQKDAIIILKDLARKLKNLKNAAVEISGYCAMTGTEEGRERLSKERAYNVLNYLKKEGWEPETAPVIKWYGGSRPVTYDQNEIYKNRRVEIKIVPQE